MNPAHVPSPVPSLSLSLGGSTGAQGTGGILLVVLLAVLPGLLVLATSFLRISVVLEFVKRALSLQAAPSAQVMTALALILTLFVMWPTLVEVQESALAPFLSGRMDSTQAFARAEKPLRLFMYRQLQNDPDMIRTFMAMRGLDKPATLYDVPTYVLLPAFALHELTVAFRIGVLVLLPFLLIDLLVSALLVAAGMVMIPPSIVSLPFKLAVFVLADGWNILFRQLFLSFV